MSHLPPLPPPGAIADMDQTIAGLEEILDGLIDGYRLSRASMDADPAVMTSYLANWIGAEFSQYQYGYAFMADVLAVALDRLAKQEGKAP